jgi:D-alanyl-D-alanine carboxypeptidase (penicillin-binding protein 5/6)
VTLPIGRYATLKSSVVLAPLTLPLKRGQGVGTLVLSADGKEVAQVPLVALQAVDKAGWFGTLWNKVRGAI